MCIDANAAARNAAKQRYAEKDAKYRSTGLKFSNKETGATRGMQRAATGYSKGISNDYQRALYVQGQARKAEQAGYIKYLQSKGSVDEGGRDRRAKTKGLVALTRARGALTNAVASEFGVQMQRRYRGRLAKMQSVQAKVRENLGLPPEYGAPVMMPPSDRLSGALSIASTIVGIATGVGDLGLGGKKSNLSDIFNNDAFNLGGLNDIDLDSLGKTPSFMGSGLIGGWNFKTS